MYIGQMKGYRGLLREIGPNLGKIECPGRQPPTFTAPLKHLVLMLVFHNVNLINIVNCEQRYTNAQPRRHKIR
jgi:hypothetical protein